MKRKPKIETCKYQKDTRHPDWMHCMWSSEHEVPRTHDKPFLDLKLHCNAKECKCWEPKEDGK